MPRTEAQIAGDRKRCLNGVRPMTREEKKAYKRRYKDALLADPFRHRQYTEYFRKRRARPGMRERTNEQGRARYNADVDKARAYCREKYRRMMSDPDRRAAYFARKKARRYAPDGTKSAAFRREEIKGRLVPRWEKVVAEGREDAYIRRTTEENARLFNMWRFSRPLFDQMLESSRRHAK